MKNLLVVFSHGKESGPWGSKIQALAKVAERLGGDVISVDYREHPVGVHHDQNVEGEAVQTAQTSITRNRVSQIVKIERVHNVCCTLKVNLLTLFLRQIQ